MILCWSVHLGYKTFELSNKKYFNYTYDKFIPTTTFARDLLEILQYE